MGEAFVKLPQGAKKFNGDGKRVSIGKNDTWVWNMVCGYGAFGGGEF